MRGITREEERKVAGPRTSWPGERFVRAENRDPGDRCQAPNTEEEPGTGHRETWEVDERSSIMAAPTVQKTPDSSETRCILEERSGPATQRRVITSRGRRANLGQYFRAGGSTRYLGTDTGINRVS